MNTPTIAGVLSTRAAACPDEPFVKCEGEWRSLADIDAASGRVAGGLAALGVSKGDRIGFLLSTREELVVLFFACAKVGAVFVPLNIYLKGRFLEHQLSDAGVSVLVVDEEGLLAAKPVLEQTSVKHVVTVDDIDEAGVGVLTYRQLDCSAQLTSVVTRSPRELAAIVYTSGTTGAPKGCMLSDGYLIQLPRAQREAEWLVPGDRIFTTWPMFHVSGVNALLCALTERASICLKPRFSASTFMAEAKADGATVVYGVGPMASAILAQPPSPSDADCAMRMALFVPLTVDLQEKFERRFNTPVIAEAYGQTEVSPFTLSSVSGPRKRNSVGRCVSYLEVAIVDENDMAVPNGAVGEIVVRPTRPDVYFFQGYWNNLQATANAFRNLWHHTGDCGSIDEAGFVYFVGRKSDSVRRRGENVSAFEVENAIVDHPAVERVAVTAVPSPLGEDDIRATILLAPGATIEPEEFFAFLHNNLPYFAVPRYVDVRSDFPVNALGKVMKHELRSEGLPADAWDFESLGLTVPRDQRRSAAVARNRSTT